LEQNASMPESPAATASPLPVPETVSIRSFDPAQLTPQENYKLLAGSVLPRPIAFVSTINPDGVRNLAPYSFFTVASANPPVLCFSPSVREPKSGLARHKDTLENIRLTGEFVVNIVSEDFAAQMNQTATQVPPSVDEFELAGLTPLPSEVVRAPRVAESRVQMECRLLQIIEVSKLPLGGSLVLGEVVRFHVSDTVLGDALHIDPDKLQAVGRMAGSDYIRTADRFALDRPK
jgi:flavin reductase (DIM6/NTAB) family NADH-FMN oxidoreductase RutF